MNAYGYVTSTTKEVVAAVKEQPETVHVLNST